MQSETLPLRPAAKPGVKYDPRSVMAAACCLAALFFNVLGWLLAIAGIVLLRRAVFQPNVKWILAAVALAPKILFLGVQYLSPPPGLSFTIEPRTLATSSALWSWSILLAGIGFFFLYVPRRFRGAPGVLDPPAQSTRSGASLFKVAGLVAIAVAIAMLLGLTDDFQRIQDEGGGRWALRHALRGAVATFAPDELASIEATERSSRGSSSYSVRVRLTNGGTFSASTSSAMALQDLRKFAATAGLRPGTVSIRRRRGRDWTNSAAAFTPTACIGTYAYAGDRSGERSTLEFWLQDGRLAGKETTLDGQRRLVRTLRDIKISDTGEFEFEESPYAEGTKTQSTISFSLRWSAQGETGRFTEDGLEIGLKKYRKQ